MYAGPRPKPLPTFDTFGKRTQQHPGSIAQEIFETARLRGIDQESNERDRRADDLIARSYGLSDASITARADVYDPAEERTRELDREAKECAFDDLGGYR